MSDGGKKESEIINYSVNRGNKYNQMENERTALMENESHLSDSSKSGSERNFSPQLNCLQWPVTENFIKLKNIKDSSLHKIQRQISYYKITQSFIEIYHISSRSEKRNIQK